MMTGETHGGGRWAGVMYDNGHNFISVGLD